jgi:hypothetical protein
MPGATPIYGWPYPTYTDPADLSADLQALATAIDTTVGNLYTLSNFAYDSAPSVVATGTANQAVANNTNVTLTFDTEVYDNAAWFTAPSTTFTAPTNGLYLVSCRGRFDTTGVVTGGRQVSVLVNGSVAGSKSELAFAGINATVNFQTHLVLVAGNTVTFTARQNSGGALNIGLKRMGITRVTR